MSVVLNELEIMRPLLPLVALVASGLHADALAPVEGDPPNVPVFPTGDAEGPSFYSHSPLPVSPHSKIHHRRSISALALIVPIVAVVFLIYQCILHLKRRDDPFITVQSRRLASGELDPCSAPDGEESGSDPAALPTGNDSPHGKQLARLQLKPPDTACLTQEEVRGVGDALRVLQTLVQEIRLLEQRFSSLSTTAASLRASLATPPGWEGPEGEQKKKELQKMLHNTSQEMDKVRAQLVEKKFHCNDKMWTAGQDSTALLLRAQLFASGRPVTNGAAAALVARDIVLGMRPDLIFDGALQTALGALVHHLLGEGRACEGLLLSDRFPSEEDLQRAKTSHADLQTVAAQLKKVDAMYGSTGHLDPITGAAESLGSALARVMGGPTSQKPQTRVSVTPDGQPIPSGDLGPPGHPLWTPYGSQWSLTDRGGLGGRHPSVSSLPGSAPLSSSASLRGPATGGFHRRGPSDPRYGSLPRMGRHSSLGAPGPEPWHLFGSGFSGGMSAPFQRQPGAPSTRSDGTRRRASVAHVPSPSPHPRASTSSAGEGFLPGADPRGPHHRPGSAPRSSSASSRRSDGVPASQAPAEPRFGAAPRRGHSQRTAAPQSTGDPRRGPSPAPHPPSSQRPGTPLARPPATRPTPSGTPGMPHGQQPHGQQPYPPYVHPPVTSQPVHFPGAPATSGRRIDVPPPRAPQPPPPPAQPAPSPSPSPYPSPSPAQWPGAPHAPPSIGPIPSSTPGVPAPGQRPQAPPPQPPTTASTPSHPPGAPPHLGRRIDVPPDPVAPPTHSTTAPAPVPPSTRGVPPMHPPQPTPYPIGAPSQRPSTSSAGRPHAPGPAPPSAPAAPPTQPTQPTPYPTTAPSQRPSTSAVGRLDVPPPSSTSAPAAPPTQPPQPMPYPTTAPSQRPSTSSTGWPDAPGPAPPSAPAVPPMHPPQPTPHPAVAPSPRPSTSSVGLPVAPPPPPPPTKGPPPPTLPKPKWKPPPPSSSPDPSTSSVHGPGDSPAQAPQPDPTAGPPPSTPSTEDAGTPRARTPTAHPGYGSLPRTSSSGRSGHSGLGPRTSSTGSIGSPISGRMDVPPDAPSEEGPKFGTPPRKLPTLLIQHLQAPSGTESAPSDVETQPPEQPVHTATDAPAPPPGPPQQPQPETPGEPSAPSPSQVALQSMQPSGTPAPPPSTTPEEPDGEKSKKKSKKGKKAKSSDGGEPEGGTPPKGKKKSSWGWGSKRKSKDSKVTSPETAPPPPPPPSQDPVEPSTSSTTSTSPPGPQEPALRPPSAPGIPAVPSEAPQAPSPPPSSSTSTAPPPGPPTESVSEPRAASPAPSPPGPATPAPPVLPPRPDEETPPYQGPAPIQQPGSPPEHPPSLPGVTVPPTPTPAPPSDGPQPALPLDYQGGARPKYGRPPTVPVPQLDRPAPTDPHHRKRGPITPGLAEEWLSTSPVPPTPPPPATPPQTHEGELHHPGPVPDPQRIPLSELFLGHPAGVTSPPPTPAPPSDAPHPPPPVAYAWGTPAPAPHVAPPHEPLTEHGPVPTPSGLQLGAPGVSIGPEYPPVPLTAPEDEPVGPSGEFPPSPPDGLGPEEWPEPPQLPPWQDDAYDFPMDMQPPPPPPEEGQQQPGDASPPPEEPSPPTAVQPTPAGGDPPPPERPPPKREPSDQSGLATDKDLEELAQTLESYALGAEVVADTVKYDPKLLPRAEELFDEGSSLLAQAAQVVPSPHADPRKVENLKSRINNCHSLLSNFKRECRRWVDRLSELETILKTKTEAVQTSRMIDPGMLPDWQVVINMDALRSSMEEARQAHTALGALGEHFADSPTRQSTLQAVSGALATAEQEVSLTGGHCAAVCAKVLRDSMPATPESSLPPAEDSILVTAQSFSSRLRALGISGQEMEDLDQAIKARQRLAGIY